MEKEPCSGCKGCIEKAKAAQTKLIKTINDAKQFTNETGKTTFVYFKDKEIFFCEEERLKDYDTIESMHTA